MYGLPRRYRSKILLHISACSNRSGTVWPTNDVVGSCSDGMAVCCPWLAEIAWLTAATMPDATWNADWIPNYGWLQAVCVRAACQPGSGLSCASCLRYSTPSCSPPRKPVDVTVQVLVFYVVVRPATAAPRQGPDRLHSVDVYVTPDILPIAVVNGLVVLQPGV